MVDIVILWNGFHSIRHRKIVFLSNHTKDKPERRMTIRNNIRKRYGDMGQRRRWRRDNRK
jgi:hypothetical protein